MSLHKKTYEYKRILLSHYVDQHQLQNVCDELHDHESLTRYEVVKLLYTNDEHQQ